MELPQADDWLNPPESEEELRALNMPIHRGRHEPTDFSRAQVAEMAGIGYLTEERIAKVMQISTGTLKKYYPEELAHGAALKTLAVAKNMYRIATGPDDKLAAQVGMWWLERRGGDIWKRPSDQMNVTVEEKPPIIDSSKLTFEHRQQLKQIILAATQEAAEPVEKSADDT